MNVPLYHATLILTCQHRAPGTMGWIEIPNDVIGDLSKVSTWTKWFPLRVNMIGNRKAAIARSPNEVKRFAAELAEGEFSMLPRDLGLKTEEMLGRKRVSDPVKRNETRPFWWVNSHERNRHAQAPH